MKKIEKHFVLVHGGGFGAWVWYKLVALLKSSGHKITAIDLAGSGIHPKREEEVNSLSEYSEPLIEHMATLQAHERVVLVGHSFGGVAVSLAMEKFPQKIAVAVFLGGVMPGPDVNMDVINQAFNEQADYMDCQWVFSNGEEKPPTSILFGPEFLSSKLCSLSAPEDMSLSSLLIRPIATSILEEKLEENALTKHNYGSVRRVYFMIENDNSATSNVQKFIIDKNPPDDVKIIQDSDHMVMFSNPQELCSLLQEISHKYI